jgi:excisionase family DNA binding protein
MKDSKTQQTTPLPIQFVSINDACTLLGGLNRSTIHRWIASGKLTGYKLGGRTLLDISQVYSKIRSAEIRA